MPEPKPSESGQSGNAKDEILAFARSIKRAEAEKRKLADQQKADDIKQHNGRATALVEIFTDNEIPFTDLAARGYQGSEIETFPKGWVLIDASPGDSAMGKGYSATYPTIGCILTPDAKIIEFAYGTYESEPAVLEQRPNVYVHGDLFVGDSGLGVLNDIMRSYKIPT